MRNGRVTRYTQVQCQRQRLTIAGRGTKSVAVRESDVLSFTSDEFLDHPNTHTHTHTHTPALSTEITITNC